MKIIENTFKNPYEIRKVALSLDYAICNTLIVQDIELIYLNQSKVNISQLLKNNLMM